MQESEESDMFEEQFFYQRAPKKLTEELSRT